MTYQPKIYRKQGAAEMVIASGGKLNLESGSTATLAGNVSITGTMALDATASVYETAQSLAVAGLATPITNVGCTFVVGSTTGPVYTLAAPTVAGMAKDICLTASSSGETHRAVIYGGSTGISFGAADLGNQLTLATSAAHSVRLRAASATNWRIVGFYPVIPTFSNKTT